MAIMYDLSTGTRDVIRCGWRAKESRRSGSSEPPRRDHEETDINRTISVHSE